MEKFKALVFGALIFTSILSVQSASEENFEDADKDSDYSSSSFNGNNEKWDLRHTIPGEPDIDYPIYAYPIKTSFSCDSRHQGYYADVEARCQVFRICTNTALSGEGFAFLCPNGTLFSQKNFVCDWYRNVDCNDSENFYFKNEEIGKSMNHDNLMESVKEMVEYPMRTISKALGLGGSSNLDQSKSQNETISINHSSSSSSILPNNTNGEKLSRNQITDRNKSAGIDIRSDFKETAILPDKNQRTLTRHNQQTSNRGRQRNDNRGRGNNIRNNQNTNIKSGPIQTTSTIEKEQTDSQKYILPDKIYVNTLGELSTDVGSNFDIKTSYIIQPDADSQKQRGSKKSLDDVIGDSEAYKNHLKNQQREKLKEGLLGSTNNNHNNKILSTTIRTTTIKLFDQQQQEDNLQIQSDTKLSFAESINAGLTNLQNPKILIPSSQQKLIKTNENNYLNLADNINSGLFGEEKKIYNKIDIPETIKKQENYQRTINIESKLGTASSRIGQSFQGYEPSRLKTTTQNPNSFRNGRQFKFLGSGFTRTGETESITVQPYISNLKNNGYLPPLLGSTSSSRNNNGAKAKDSLITQLNNQENLKNLLLDINNINNNDEVSASNIDQVHVKKRAEELLLQGVHQTLYENDKTDDDDNNYNNIINNNKKFIDDINIIQDTTENINKMVIRVYGDSQEDDNNNNTDNDNILNINNDSITNVNSNNINVDSTNNSNSNNINNNNNNNVTEPFVQKKFRLTTELSAGPILVTDLNVQNTENINLNIPTEEITDSDIITSTTIGTILTEKSITENAVTDVTNNNSSTLLLLDVKSNGTGNLEKINNKLNNNKFRKLNNNLTDRRQTAKPIIYSKKPYTLRSYTKLSTTTTNKPYKYLENRRNNYRNRLINNGNNNNNNNGNNNNNELNTVTDTNLLRKNNEQHDLNDLTAVANTYGLSNKLQNNTKYTLLTRRTKPTYSLRTKSIISTTTILPSINSNLNLTSISNFVPFGNNIINKDIDNNLQFNLQNLNNNNYNNNNNNINNNIQQQQQQQELKNQKSTYYSIGTQQGNQKTESNLIKPLGTYTEIPGTNIKISKSNEETSFILSSDPRHQPQLIKIPPTINKEKNGYIPLNEYITNTLNGEIRNLATQTSNINNNNNNNNNNNYNFNQQQENNLLPQFISTISPIQQQQQQINFGLTQTNVGQNNNYNNHINNFQTSPQFPSQQINYQNLGYQIVATTIKPYGHELTSFGNSLINQQQQQQQQHPLLTQSYYNSFNSHDILGSLTTQKPSTNVNIYNNLSESAVILPDISISTNNDNNFNNNQNLQSNYQNFIFNPLPIAQRRLDVVKDDEKESEIYNKGITSYNVPIGSIGRLGRRLALKQLQQRRN